jgi:hypothetical protein
MRDRSANRTGVFRPLAQLCNVVLCSGDNSTFGATRIGNRLLQYTDAAAIIFVTIYKALH